MYPTPKTDHVTEGLSRLTSVFRSLPNMRAVLTSYLNRVQDLENTIWQVIAAQQLAQNPTGKSLENLAALVNEVRGTFNDSQLLLWIKVIIRAWASAGLAEDAIQIAALALGSGVATYTDYPPAAYQVQALNIESDFIVPLAGALHLAKDPGVLGEFEYSYWPHSQDIILDDTVGRNVGAQGFRDGLSGRFPFDLIGAVQL